MKTLFLTIMIVIIMLCNNDGILAQTKQNKLDQVELMKQFSGTWKGETGKDTIVTGEDIYFGTGLDCNIRVVANDNIPDSAKQFYGDEKKGDKFIIAELINSCPVIELSAIWFTSKNSGEMVLLQDISDPENAALKWKFEFESPDMIVQAALKNSKVYKVITTIRIK